MASLPALPVAARDKCIIPLALNLRCVGLERANLDLRWRYNMRALTAVACFAAFL